MCNGFRSRLRCIDADFASFAELQGLDSVSGRPRKNSPDSRPQRSRYRSPGTAALCAGYQSPWSRYEVNLFDFCVRPYFRNRGHQGSIAATKGPDGRATKREDFSQGCLSRSRWSRLFRHWGPAASTAWRPRLSPPAWPCRVLFAGSNGVFQRAGSGRGCPEACGRRGRNPRSLGGGDAGLAWPHTAYTDRAVLRDGP